MEDGPLPELALTLLSFTFFAFFTGRYVRTRPVLMLFGAVFAVWWTFQITSIYVLSRAKLGLPCVPDLRESIDLSLVVFCLILLSMFSLPYCAYKLGECTRTRKPRRRR